MTKTPTTAALTVLATLAALPTAAHAQDDSAIGDDYGVPGYSRDPDSPDFSPYSPFYNGSFVALGAFAGTNVLSLEGLDVEPSYAWGAWAQLAAPLSVLDFRLSYHGSRSEAVDGAGRAIGIRQDTLSLAAAGHPMFLAHLENSWFYYALGSIYLLLGVDLEFVQAAHAGEESDEFDLGVQLGLGFDIALDDVDDGGAFWLGFQYLFNQWDFVKAPLRNVSVDQHLLLLKLSYRKNGMLVVL